MNGDEVNEWESFEGSYNHKYPLDRVSTLIPTSPALFSRDVSSVFLMHPRCWDFLLQQHALVESPVKPCLDLDALSKIFLQIPLGAGGGDFRPDWVTDCAGPELFFWDYEILSFRDAREWRRYLHPPSRRNPLRYPDAFTLCISSRFAACFEENGIHALELQVLAFSIRVSK